MEIALALSRAALPPSYPARPHKGGVPLGMAWKQMSHNKTIYTPKYNGWRVLLHVPTGVCYNRHLELLTIGEEFKESIYKIQKCCPDDIEWLDCEGLERRHGIGKGTLIVLDFIPPIVQHEPLNTTYEDRMSVLAVTLDRVPWHEHYEKPKDDSVYLPPHFSANDVELIDDELKDMNKKWDAEFYEGWVGIKADSKYPVQLVSEDKKALNWTKHRWDS